MAEASDLTNQSTDSLVQQWLAGTLKLKYHAGMQQETLSESKPGVIPELGNTPQKCPYGLYAEQLSGTSFTTPRVKNLRSWLYRIYPSVFQSPFQKVSDVINPRGLTVTDFSKSIITPKRLRFKPVSLRKSEEKVMFHESWITTCGSGSAESKQGMAAHIYSCNSSMIDTAMCNADGDLLIVPSQGELFIRTEFGCMTVPIGHFCVIQRGITFAVFVKEPSRGYIAELFESHFVIPDLGPIGANGLAMPKHFETVSACYEDRTTVETNGEGGFTVIQKFLGEYFSSVRSQSVFNVVGWVGNYVPFRYDLRRFNVVGSISFDHLDPCTFTVLTAQTSHPGVAALDFVVFPPRWKVHTDTFRPPYYHRNTMSEYMGVISGEYEVREGFTEGSGSLHNCMSPHGPDWRTFEAASSAQLTPQPPSDDGFSFMFESTYILRVTDYFMDKEHHSQTYVDDNWLGFVRHFTPSKL